MIDATTLERWTYRLDEIVHGVESAGEEAGLCDDPEEFQRDAMRLAARLRALAREMKDGAIALARAEARTTEPA